MPLTTSFKIKRNDSERVVSDVVIERAELRIGSQQDDIDLFLNHPGVSSVHARIREEDGTFWISDTLDMNPTLLNGRCISRAPLQNGDKIQIGPFILHFDQKEVLITVVRDLKADVKPPEDVSTLITHNPLNVLQPPDREAGKLAISTPLYPAGLYGNAKARFIWTPTADLKPPIRREVWLTRAVTAVALASIGALFFCSGIYSPGPLASAHSSSPVTRGIALSTASSCSDCHHLLGKQERDCSECHQVPPGTGSALGFDPRMSPAHQDANIGCVGCHTEHGGLGLGIKEVDNRSCMSCHNDKYEFRGKAVKTPHKNSMAKSSIDSPEKAGVWYVRDDQGAWVWTNRTGTKLTGEDAKVSFHREHPYADREMCSYCHQGVRGTDLYRESPRTACQACHAVTFATGEPKAIGSNCASCHKQHGKYTDLKLAIARIPDRELRKYLDNVKSNGLYGLGDTTEPFIPSALGGASVKRQGLVNWNWAFISRLGLVPWHIWSGSISIFALGGAMLVIFGNARRTSLLLEASAAWRLPRGTRADQEREGTAYQRKPPAVFTFPIIKLDYCIGCHACIDACPHEVLTMFEGKAMALALNQCMDDTGCQEACPTQACMVANTEKTVPAIARPERDQVTYMTNQPGIFVIGEVARVPLIRFAVLEGACVIDTIDAELKQEAVNTAQYDVAIIGAGPAGLSAALRAVEKGMTYVVVERNESLATIKGYPDGKCISLATEGNEPQCLLPVPSREPSPVKEEILKFWTSVIARNNLKIIEHEACTRIVRGEEFFTVATSINDGSETRTYTARRIVLAIGRSGTPTLAVDGVDSKIPIHRRATKCQNCNAPCQPQHTVCSSCNAKIDRSVPGLHLEDKVQYKLTDAGVYDGLDCAVAGGGNSAIEAAVALTGFERHGDDIKFKLNNRVTLLVRSDFTPDLKFVNKVKLYDCVDAGRIDLRFQTQIEEIRQIELILKNKKTKEISPIPNDYLFCCIGTQWPEEFLKNVGITIVDSRRDAAKQKTH